MSQPSALGNSLGPYQLIRPLGQGTGGKVWLAKRTMTAHGQNIQKTCALKERAIPEDDPEVIDFLREWSIGNTVQHPNVVKVESLERLDGRLCVEMEYIDGKTFEEILRRVGERGCRVPLRPAVDMAIGVAAGLHAIHQARGMDSRPLGLVHRDIKPSNLMVDRHSVVKILDLGIVRAELGTRHTELNMVKGTRQYMAPEQHKDKALGPGTDLFALGVVLFELLTGEELFAYDEAAALLRRKSGGFAERQLQEHAALLGPLAPVLGRCLQPRLEDRYATAADLEKALRDIRHALPQGPDLSDLVATLDGRPPRRGPLSEDWSALVEGFGRPYFPKESQNLAELALERPASSPPEVEEPAPARPARDAVGWPAPVVTAPLPLGEPDPAPAPASASAPEPEPEPELWRPAVTPPAEREGRRWKGGQPSLDDAPIAPAPQPSRSPGPEASGLSDALERLGERPRILLLVGIAVAVAVLSSILLGWLMSGGSGDGGQASPQSPPAASGGPGDGTPAGVSGAATAEPQPGSMGPVDCYVDQDKDGYGAEAVPGSPVQTCTGEGVSVEGGDCDDGAATVNPGATEICDGLDNDCDGAPGADEVDLDGDGDPGCNDCDDHDRKRSHLVREIAADGVDQDCDNRDRCYLDGDADGFGGARMGAPPGLSCAVPGFSAITGDCDDSNASSRPGGKEIPGDGRDNDCNGQIDEAASPPRASPTAPSDSSAKYMKVKLVGTPQASTDRKKKVMTVSVQVSDPDKTCRKMSLRWRSESMDGADVAQFDEQGNGLYSVSVDLPSKGQVQYYPRCCYYMTDCVDLRSPTGQSFTFNP